MERGYPCIACTMVRGRCGSTPSRGGASGGGGREGTLHARSAASRPPAAQIRGSKASDRPDLRCDLDDCAIGNRPRLCRPERSADRSGNAHFVGACLGERPSTSRRRDHGISPMATNAASRFGTSAQGASRQGVLASEMGGPDRLEIVRAMDGEGASSSSNHPARVSHRLKRPQGLEGIYALRSGPAQPDHAPRGGHGRPNKKGCRYPGYRHAMSLLVGERSQDDLALRGTQLNATRTFCARRRMATPTAAIPATIIAQVAGSGIGAMSIVPL